MVACWAAVASARMVQTCFQWWQTHHTGPNLLKLKYSSAEEGEGLRCECSLRANHSLLPQAKPRHLVGRVSVVTCSLPTPTKSPLSLTKFNKITTTVWKVSGLLDEKILKKLYTIFQEGNKTQFLIPLQKGKSVSVRDMPRANLRHHLMWLTCEGTNILGLITRGQWE